MDFNLLRSAITVVSFLTFLGVIYWAYNEHNRARFEQEGRRVLDDEERARHE
jgi:cytochrome c oxidase cbb3-type subunit 4